MAARGRPAGKRHLQAVAVLAGEPAGIPVAEQFLGAQGRVEGRLVEQRLQQAGIEIAVRLGPSNTRALRYLSTSACISSSSSVTVLSRAAFQAT